MRYSRGPVRALRSTSGCYAQILSPPTHFEPSLTLSITICVRRRSTWICIWTWVHFSVSNFCKSKANYLGKTLKLLETKTHLRLKLRESWGRQDRILKNQKNNFATKIRRPASAFSYKTRINISQQFLSSLFLSAISTFVFGWIRCKSVVADSLFQLQSTCCHDRHRPLKFSINKKRVDNLR